MATHVGLWGPFFLPSAQKRNRMALDVGELKMQHTSPLAHKVEQAVTDLLAHAGYELIMVEFLTTSRLLRLYIDLPYDAAQAAELEADEAQHRTITLDDCTKVSQLVSDVLDGEGIMDGGEGAERGSEYRLEVSSPGLDRPLCKPVHFQRFVGDQVRLRTRVKLPGLTQRRFEATLLAADAEGIDVHVDAQDRRIAYTELDKAQLSPTF